MAFIPKDIAEAMIDLADYFRRGTLTNGYQIDDDVRNVVLAKWISLCFPNVESWESFADAIAGVDFDKVEMNNLARINPDVFDKSERFYYEKFGWTIVPCSKLKEGDIIKVEYKNEPIIGIVLATAKSQNNLFYLYFTVRGVRKNSPEFRTANEPFNGAIEDINYDFKVKVLRDRKIPKGFRGLGNLTTGKTELRRESSSWQPKGLGGKMAKGVANYLGRQTLVGQMVNSVRKF